MNILGYNINKVKNLVQPTDIYTAGKYQYVVRSKTIENANVEEYRTALDSARSAYVQQRQTIYNYYQNAIDLDAHLTGLIEKRLLATVGRKLIYVNDAGQEVEAVNQMTSSPVFEKFIRELLSAKVFWGLGLFLFEADSTKPFELKYATIPVQNIDPYQKMVRYMPFGITDKDKSFSKDNMATLVGQQDLGGLLLQASLVALRKREALNDWASYSQLAGNNFMVVKYRSEKPDEYAAKTARETVANAGRGVFSAKPGVDIEAQNLSSSSQNQLFTDYVKYLDDTLTKLVLGQTMTTEDGASRSQAEVHERVQDTIFDSDAKFVTDYLNYDWLDIGKKYGVMGGKWQYAESGTQKMMQQIELDLKLKELGVLFTSDELRQKYNLI